MKNLIDRNLIIILSLILGFYSIFALLFLLPNWKNDETFNIGILGDSFGTINSLFSGLALGGLIYSIYLQKKELNEARKEFRTQNFDNKFFLLLEHHTKTRGEFTSRVHFNHNPDTFSVIVSDIDNHRQILVNKHQSVLPSKVERIQGIKEISSLNNNYFVRYVKSISLVLKTIASIEETVSILEYADILNSSMSNDEIKVLLYFSLSSDQLMKHLKKCGYFHPDFLTQYIPEGDRYLFS